MYYKNFVSDLDFSLITSHDHVIVYVLIYTPYFILFLPRLIVILTPNCLTNYNVESEVKDLSSVSNFEKIRNKNLGA